MSKNKKNYASLSKEELQNELISLKKDALSLRFQKTMGSLTNVSQMQKTRRNIARVLTQLNAAK